MEKVEKVSVERELVSKAEEEDMEALLGTYVSPYVFGVSACCAKISPTF